MSDNELIFHMGLYDAILPVCLQYSGIHFWFDVSNGKTRCGMTAFASRLLGDVFRLEWAVAVGDDLLDASVLGEIESTKATSELYAPMAGKLLAINVDIIEEPSAIAHDPYTAWMLEFEGVPEFAMSAEAYKEFLEDGWEETERLLKGQS